MNLSDSFSEFGLQATFSLPAPAKNWFGPLESIWHKAIIFIILFLSMFQEYKFTEFISIKITVAQE